MRHEKPHTSQNPVFEEPLEQRLGAMGAERTPEQIAEDQRIDVLTRGVNPDRLDEEALETLIDQHPIVREKTEALNSKRQQRQLSHTGEQRLVEDIRRNRQDVAGRIKRKLGIFEEDPEVIERRQETERLRAMGHILKNLTDDESDDALLVKYGFIDEEGKMTPGSMESPLFKADTKRAFKQYMEYAIQFDAMQEVEASEGHSLRNTEQASNVRVQAHDAVTKLVVRDTGIPQDQARRFVAKAREAIVPNSHEKASYADRLRSQKLSEQFGRDALAFTRDRLGAIISDPMEHEK